MRVLAFLIIALFLGSYQCAQSDVPTPPQKRTLLLIEVISVNRPMFGSGISKAWALIGVRQFDGTEIVLHALYGGESDVFPEVGAKCSAMISNEAVKGITEQGTFGDVENIIVVHEMKCADEIFNQWLR